MKQWVNASFHKTSFPLLNYSMGWVLMVTGTADHINSIRSLPEMLWMRRGHTSPFLFCSKSQAVMSRKVSSIGRG